eukprot:7741448-Alexandrium_andersonii.AAC.1
MAMSSICEYACGYAKHNNCDETMETTPGPHMLHTPQSTKIARTSPSMAAFANPLVLRDSPLSSNAGTTQHAAYQYECQHTMRMKSRSATQSATHKARAPPRVPHTST